MRKSLLLLLTVFLAFCSESDSNKKEVWFDKPVSDWPSFALTNRVEFADKTYNEIANGFLIRTEADTFAVTAKHLFLVFRQNGLTSIDLGENFVRWEMFPKGQPDKKIAIAELLNGDPAEGIGEFNTLKVRDWLLFKIEKQNPELFPLKIRTKPVKKGETVYAVGWSKAQKTKEPAVIKMKIFKEMGDYAYFQTLTQNVDPVGRSGSAVLDENGYLVGIISGAEGNLGVMGSVRSLQKVFDTFGIITINTEK